MTLDLTLRWRVLLFTVAATVATALLSGVAPALRAGRFALYEAVRQQGGALAGERSGALGGRLVVLQVALSLVLVFAAGLFLRTFSHLAGRDLGLDRGGILLVGVDAQRSVDAAERNDLYARVEQAVGAVAGVEAAATSLVGPVSGAGWNEFFSVRGEAPLSGDDRLSWVNAVTPGWFATYGTRLLAGRDFDAQDRTGSPRVAIVNEAFARRFLGGRSPIGHVVQQESTGELLRAPVEIVGVVRDTVYRSPRDRMEPILYLPMRQLSAEETWPFATLGVRSAIPPALLVRGLVAAVGRVDPRLSLSFRAFAEQIGAAIRRERVVAALSAFFGGLALLLAGIGLYGVTAYSVSRRRREIAMRMALGADTGGVLRLVLGGALRLVGLGLTIGAVLGLWASRFVGSLLFGLEPRDLPTLLAVAAVLAAVCTLASAVPARRATRVDPAQVLREG